MGEWSSRRLDLLNRRSNMAAGGFRSVAQEAFNIGDSGPCGLAECAKKVGGVADQPPFGIAEHFGRHGQGGGGVVDDLEAPRNTLENEYRLGWW